jgi:hypothetical protein
MRHKIEFVVMLKILGGKPGNVDMDEFKKGE